MTAADLVQRGLQPCRGTRPFQHHEVCQLKNLTPAMPAGELCEGVAAEHPDKPLLADLFADLVQRLHSVGRPRTTQLTIIGNQALIVRTGKAQHGPAVLGGCARRRAMARSGREDHGY